ncbi:MAG: hypothetical protein H6797_00735 [Candidatus Nomurabacteria bacterium]|nr:MAG: hypothetical protein H6797_00735 [Candidatus Nomurabacteria bacterium]
MTEKIPQGRAPIDYPYMHEDGVFVYVEADNVYMQVAKEYAKRYSLDKVMPNTSIVVLDGEVIGIGANGSDYHETNGCERIRLGSPSGQDYDKCEGCHPKNHGEPRAVGDAQVVMGSQRLDGAEVYLWGHYWCCESCWDAMISSGINTVYLLEGSEVLFNKQHPDNVVGRQFES